MEETVELKELIEVVLKGKWIITISTILAMLVAGVISWFVLDEQYESKSVVQISGGVQDTGIMSNYVASEFTPTIYVQRIQNEVSMQQAFEEAGYKGFSYGNLTVINQPNTELVELVYRGSTPEDAQQHLSLLLETTKAEMDLSVKETLNQLEKTYLNESKALSKEIEQLMTQYNNIVVSNKLPEVLILQTIASTQFVLNLTSEQTVTLSSITGALQNELLQLKVQIDIKSNEYRNVLAKYQSVKTGLDSFKPDPFVRVIVAPTLIDMPISPNKTLNLAIGVLVGLMMGLIIVFTRFYLRTTNK